MGLKAGLNLLQQTGKAVARYTDDAARLVVKSGDDVARALATKTDDAVSIFGKKANYTRPDRTKVKVTDEQLEMLGLQGSASIKPKVNPSVVETPTRVLQYSKQELDFFTENISGHSQSEIKQALDEILSLKDVSGKDIFYISPHAHEIFATRTYSARALLEARFNDPQRYDDIMKLLNLHQTGKIKYCPKFIMPNGKLNPLIKEDMEALISGKPYFQQFKPNTMIDDFTLNYHKIKEGDAFSIGERMFVRDGNGYQLLKMDKKTYELLFPPVDRYVMAQGASVSCGPISMINNLVQVPQNRVKMYQLFEQNGSKITVHALGDVHSSRTFDLNDLRILEDEKLSKTSIGLKMLEHKGCFGDDGEYLGGIPHREVGAVHNLRNEINSTPTENPKFNYEDYFMTKNNPLEREKMVRDVQAELSTIGKGRTFVTIGGGGYKLGMGVDHCCSVYECQNGIVKVANPHGTAECLEIPLDLFYGTKKPYFTRGVFDNS